MHDPLSRRSFLATAAAFAASAGVQASQGRQEISFRHGVASGDPLQDRVILWTRVTAPNWYDDVEVKWHVARDPKFRKIVVQGRANANVWRDFTVKVDVDGLEPGRTYYYCFTAGGEQSVTGRTRTLPRHASSARLAMVSCSNLPQGFFNVYALIARRADLDAVLHLGDYLYEYANGGFGNGTALGRVPNPDKEIVSLLDYRLRHAQYKGDADLQEAHRQHPFICVWDDHEIANDAWKDGAENHNPELGEGEYSARKRAAIRAYFEWMPIREWPFRPNTRIFRQFRFGELADVLMLDTRHYARDQQSAVKPVSPTAGFPAIDPVINDPSRTLLGFDQEAWLAERLSLSQSRGVTWRLLGQQVMMAQLSVSGGQTLFNLDQWDGYRPARQRLFDTARTNKIDNLVVLTGDIHTSWANELTDNPWNPAGYDPATGRGVLGVEFVTPAVSSTGIVNPVEAAQTAAFLRSVSPHMKYVELNKRGYVLLDLDRERIQGEFWHVATVDAPSRDETLAAAFINEAGANRLQPTSSASVARQEIETAA
jgi:alkaline phosphatase D